MASKHDKEKAVNVQVLLRCRPFNHDELRNNAPQVVTCNEFQREVAVSQIIAGKQIDRVFTFDKVFGPSAKQKDLYEQAMVPIVNEVLEGFNCTIFAYGQTGTGKTYTMEGECRKAKSGPDGQLHTDAGVIPRAVKQIFDTLESQNADYSVKVTFIELYNEEITDLLAPVELSKAALDEKQRKTLPLMEDQRGGVVVRGIEEEIVTNAGEIFSLLERGSAKRRTAETLLNKQSSRSHSLFSITIHIKEATPEGEELIKCGKLNLVDLAGSENISRSGAREGRAREAGEINKSLLTLGRVITALVEHLGHIPYRDSKLTRLLRDSLGGRTKTCIIATVSPSVHCLEETLSTLDYAHRAKNIKNKPEVNQKMHKTTLIKDLQVDIERLKAELHAAREKDGVYIPKERYDKEENERKSMAEQIEQMEILLEANQKQIENLQEKYEGQAQQSANLSKKLEATERSLEHTSKLLASVKEDMKQAQYNLKEKDFIILEQKKAENALAHQACQLQADLEKSIRDNASLFSKIARKEELNYSNRSLVDNYHADLVKKINELSSSIAFSMCEQNKHLERVQKLCCSCVDFNDKAVVELEKKVSAARALYISHIEGMQNEVRLQKADTNGSLEEILSFVSANSCSFDHLLAVADGEADLIFDDLQKTIGNYREKLDAFTTELKERFSSSLNHSKKISNFIVGVLDKIQEDSLKLESHVDRTYKIQSKSVQDIQKAFEEQSRSEAEKLVDDISSLVSSHLERQKSLLKVRLTGISEASLEDKAFLDEYTSATQSATADAKRKWEEFSKEADSHSIDGANFADTNRCQMDILLRTGLRAVSTASQHSKKTQKIMGEMSHKHVSEIQTLISTAIENNEHHDKGVAEARLAAQEDVISCSNNILQHFNGAIEHTQGSASQITAAVEAHKSTLQRLQDSHSCVTDEIKIKSDTTFRDNYMDYEPTGDTPLRSEPDVPSKGTIEALRAMPMEALLEEFRENHPYESTKEPKASLIPRSPLIQLNRISSSPLPSHQHQ